MLQKKVVGQLPLTIERNIILLWFIITTSRIKEEVDEEISVCFCFTNPKHSLIMT
jgi:hypothetical protein